MFPMPNAAAEANSATPNWNHSCVGATNSDTAIHPSNVAASTTSSQRSERKVHPAAIDSTINAVVFPPSGIKTMCNRLLSSPPIATPAATA